MVFKILTLSILLFVTSFAKAAPLIDGIPNFGMIPPLCLGHPSGSLGLGDEEANNELVSFGLDVASYDCLDNEELSSKCECLEENKFEPDPEELQSFAHSFQKQLASRDIASKVFELNRKWYIYKQLFHINGSELPKCQLNRLTSEAELDLFNIFSKPEFDHIRNFFFENNFIKSKTKIPRLERFKQSRILIDMFGGKKRDENVFSFPIKKDSLISFVTRVINSSKVEDNSSKSIRFDYSLVESNYEKFQKELLKDYSYLDSTEIKKIQTQMKEMTYLILGTTSKNSNLLVSDFDDYSKVKNIVEITLSSYLDEMREDYQRDCYAIDRELNIYNREYKKLNYYTNKISFKKLLSALESTSGGMLGVYLTCNAMKESIPSKFKDYKEALSSLKNKQTKVIVQNSKDSLKFRITQSRPWMVKPPRKPGVFFMHSGPIRKSHGIMKGVKPFEFPSDIEQAIGEIPLVIPGFTLDDEMFIIKMNGPRKGNFATSDVDIDWQKFSSVTPIRELIDESEDVETKEPTTLNQTILRKVHQIVKSRNLMEPVAEVLEATSKLIGKTDDNTRKDTDKDKEVNSVASSDSKNESEISNDEKDNSNKERAKKSFFSYFSSPISYTGQSSAVSFPSFGEEFKERDQIAYKQASVSKNTFSPKERRDSEVSPKIKKYQDKVRDKLTKRALKELTYEQFKQKHSYFKVGTPKIAINTVKANDNRAQGVISTKSLTKREQNSINELRDQRASVKRLDEKKKAIKIGRDPNPSSKLDSNSKMNPIENNPVPKVHSTLYGEGVKDSKSKIRPKMFILENDFKTMNKNDILDYADATHLVYVIVKKEVQHVLVHFLETYEYRVVAGEVFKKLISSENIFRVRPSGKKLEVMNEFFSLKRKGVLQ